MILESTVGRSISTPGFWIVVPAAMASTDKVISALSLVRDPSRADGGSLLLIPPANAWTGAIARGLPFLLLVLCAFVAGHSLSEAFSVAEVDSQDNNWGAARVLLRGFDPYKLYLNCGHCAKPAFHPAVAPMYPASALVMLWPLAALAWPAAKAAWASLNILLGAGLVATLCRLFLPDGGWRVLAWALVAFIAGTPFLNNLGNGQHAVFALAFFPAAIWAERRGHIKLASVLLAVSWFKYSLTFPLSLFFVMRGRFAVLLGAAAVHVFLTLFAAAWTGTDPLSLLLEPLRVIEGVGSVGHLELFGLATRLGLTSKLPPLIAAFALTAAVLAAIWRGRSDDDLQLLSLLALFAYAVTYHYPYDLVILVVPLVYVIDRARSWKDRDLLQRIWTVLLAVLLAWTWYADHPIQLLKMQMAHWLIAVYPAYYIALAAWFYATLFVGIAVLACRGPVVARLPARAGSVRFARFGVG
jgi:hypothetical protein